MIIKYLQHVQEMLVELKDNGSDKILDQNLFSSAETIEYLASIDDEVFEEEFRKYAITD